LIGPARLQLSCVSRGRTCRRYSTGISKTATFSPVKGGAWLRLTRFLASATGHTTRATGPLAPCLRGTARGRLTLSPIFLVSTGSVCDSGRPSLRSAHNPEVAGSNRAPATGKVLARSRWRAETATVSSLRVWSNKLALFSRTTLSGPTGSRPNEQFSKERSLPGLQGASTTWDQPRCPASPQSPSST
jgi:hypothetical protein